MTYDKASKTEYWKDHTDTARMAVCFVRNIWIVLAGIAAGIVLAIGIYFIYHAAADGVQYQAYSEFYLDFASDETGEAYQYYNGYTWNDLMTTDLIAEETLNALNGEADISRLEEDTLAEIKSDIRVLRVTITDSDKELCGDIQKATEDSLVKLGQSAKEFNSISVIKTSGPERIYADNRLLQAIELGAIAGCILSIIFLMFAFLMDDTIRTPVDLGGLDTCVLGVLPSGDADRTLMRLNDLLESNEACEVKKELERDDPDSIYRLNAAEIMDSGDTKELIEKARSSRAVIIEIPYKKVKKSVLRLLLDSLKTQDVNVLGCIISGADLRFYRTYYGLNGILR